MKTIGDRYQFLVNYHIGIDPRTNERGQGWGYLIYSQNSPNVLIAESNEWFSNEGKAALAAIGHITLLEKEISE